MKCYHRFHTGVDKIVSIPGGHKRQLENFLSSTPEVTTNLIEDVKDNFHTVRESRVTPNLIEVVKDNIHTGGESGATLNPIEHVQDNLPSNKNK